MVSASRLFFGYAWGTLVGLAVSLASSVLITRLVDPSSYATYSMFVLSGNVLVFVISGGMDQAITRYFYQSGDGCYALFRKCVAPVAGILCLVVVGAWVFRELLSRLIFGKSDALFVGLLVLYAAVLAENRFSMLLLRLGSRARAYSIVSVLSKIVYLAVTLALLLVVSLRDDLSLALGLLASVVSVTVVANTLNRRRVPRVARLGSGVVVSYRKLVSFAWPVAANNVVMAVFQMVDKFAIGRYLSRAELGVYTAASVFQSLILAFAVAFGNFFVPLAMDIRSREPSNTDFVTRMGRFSTAYAMLAGVVLIVLRGLLVNVLGPKYGATIEVLPILIVIACMSVIGDTVSIGITFLSRTHYNLFAGLVALAMCALLSLALVPMLGIRGAALSVLLATWAAFVIRLRFSLLLFPAAYGVRRMVGTMVLVSSYAVACSFGLPASWGACLSCMTAAVIVLSYPGETYQYWIMRSRAYLARRA